VLGLIVIIACLALGIVVFHLLERQRDEGR